MPCCAVLCRAVPCCAVPCCTYFSVHARYHYEVSCQVPVHQVCTYYLLNHKKCTPRSAQLSYSSAAQRSAVRYRALSCPVVPCRALPCCAVLRFAALCCAVLRCAALCCAVLCFLPNIQYQVSCQVPGTRHRYVRVYSFFCFFYQLSSLCPLHVLFCFRNLHPYCRSERDTASKHTAKHRAMSSAQDILGIIKSLVSTYHGPLLSATFTFSFILACARVAGGVSRPRSGARELFSINAKTSVTLTQLVLCPDNGHLVDMCIICQPRDALYFEG